MGIGWRTIVGVMLIGFKTEGINLPSFIMVPSEPFPSFFPYPSPATIVSSSRDLIPTYTKYEGFLSVSTVLAFLRVPYDAVQPHARIYSCHRSEILRLGLKI